MAKDTVLRLVEEMHESDEFLDPKELLEYACLDEEYLDDVYNALPHVYVSLE